jgi:hypothetical protein
MGVPKRLAAIAALCLAATGLSTATGPSTASAATRTTYHRVGVYEQSVALDSTATVAGVILPSVGQGGSGAALHVFGLAIG